ncbi:MAG TPA: SUMF1/EgtB/PvdO family nonheme iron enzyme, partial [Bacteroidia bacterium]|nr:SUMF1/EgtB/PvdO family nonheme iron enzyme [Bacteroidia bacterium]
IKDTMHRSGKMLSLSSFYMCNHVVSNAEYRYFLNDLKLTNPVLYIQMLPDTLVWRNKLAYQEPYVAYYFRHPAYSNYPVVGITHEQAEQYCKWLTERYMKEPKRKFKKVEFKLPNVYQWVYAAQGGLALPDFPWVGSDMRGKDGKPLANFIYVSEASIKKEKVCLKDSNGSYHEINMPVATGNEGYGMYGAAPTGNDAADLTTPVISYYPNGYGLYNMAGNVKQYVSEKGITKGGGWKDYGYYLQTWVEQPYDSTQKAADDRGFRIIMHVEN